MKRKTVAGMILMIALCLSPSLFSEEKASVKPNCCKGPVLCPSFPLYGDCDDCCYRWHVDIGLLYEQPHVWGTNYVDYGVNSEHEYPDEDPLEVPLTTFKLLIPCYNYDVGVTASLGVLMNHDDWYVGLDFDWLYSRYTKIYITKNGKANFRNSVWFDVPGYKGGLANDVTNFLSIDYKKEIAIYDLGVLLSRGAYLSRCYVLEPYMGVYALWYNACSDSKYYNENPNDSSQGKASGFGSKFTYKEYLWRQHAWGVGPMFGLNLEYYIEGGLSLFSDNRIAVLYGEASFSNVLQIINNDKNSAAFSEGTDTYCHIDCHYLFPVRSIIGVKLGKYCLEDNHYVAVKIGYDARYVYSTDVESFCLSGLYVDFIWAF